MLGNAGSPGAEVFHCRGRRGTRGTMTGTYADAEPERNSDTACLSRTHAGTSFSAPPTANCSSRIRRCCPNFFLNFLSRCPWWLQASTRAIRRASFGLCKSSTLDGRGRPNGCLPLGFPATLRMASSSRRIHASVVLTGMTETRTTSDAAPSDASRNLFGSFSVSNRVSVAMDKEQVEFGLGGKYNSYLPIQHRFSTVPRITNVGQCDCRPDHFRRAAVRQQLLEVRNQRPVRSSLTQKEKTNQSVVHEGLVV